MKTILSVVCSLMLIGCSDSTPNHTNIPLQNSAIASDTNQAEINESSIIPAAPATTVSAPIEKEVPLEPSKTAQPSAKPVEALSAKKAEIPADKPVAIGPKKVKVDAASLFGSKCAACHGTKGEKQALGKSQIIGEWSASQIADALKGYQAGTYGRETKALMQGQAKGLSAEEIEALAKHIEAL
ncbi:MAG TPA: c-type cytochrome [Sulfuricurvum sp.]|nr:c-type cytochrome [Sulfuricurvum sp.]